MYCTLCGAMIGTVLYIHSTVLVEDVLIYYCYYYCYYYTIGNLPAKKGQKRREEKRKGKKEKKKKRKKKNEISRCFCVACAEGLSILRAVGTVPKVNEYLLPHLRSK